MKLPKLCKNPDGRAYVTIPKTKKRIYFGHFGLKDTEKKYAAWCARLLADGAPPTPVSLSYGMTISELVDLYITWAETYYVEEGKPTKTFKLQEAAALLLDELFGDQFGRDIRPGWIETIQNHLAAQPVQRTGKSRVRTGINDTVNRCRQVVRWWARKEYIAPEKYAALRAVEHLRFGRGSVPESEPIKPIAAGEVDAILPFMPPPLQAMVQLQRLCGMRPQDVCRMRPCDIDRSGEIWIYTPPKHKTAYLQQTLVKAIPMAAQAILRPYLERDPQAYCFSPQEAMAWRYGNQSKASTTTRTTPVYPSELRRREQLKASRRRKKVRARQRRNHYDTYSYRRAIKYAWDKAIAAGVQAERWSPMRLRHAIATEIAERLGDQAASRYLGHRHVKTTASYIAVQKSEIVAIAKALDQKWTSSPPRDHGKQGD